MEKELDFLPLTKETNRIIKEEAKKLFEITEEDMKNRNMYVVSNPYSTIPEFLTIMNDYVENENGEIIKGKEFVDKIVVDRKLVPVENTEDIIFRIIDTHIDKDMIMDPEYCAGKGIINPYRNPGNIDLSNKVILILYKSYNINKNRDYIIKIYEFI